MKNSQFIALALGLVFGIAGCGSEPTNAPTEKDVADANAARAKAIDEDPSLTPEGKAKMKEALKLDRKQGAQGR